MTGGWDLSRRVLCLSGLAAVLLLTSAASAMGQAAVDQYLPSAKPDTRHGSAADAVAEATATTTPSVPPPQGKAKKSKSAAVVKGSDNGPSDGDDGGFALTPFVIVVIAVFLAGLAARYLPKLIRRLRPAHPS
jgi:hypothetical protein